MTAPEDVPLTARSVVASTLLGTDPPRLPVSFLVRTGQIFGFSEPAVRTALSRMVANEEAIRNDTGSYELVGHLVSRQERQREGRSASTIKWDGTWTMFVVGQGSRSSSDRARLRVSMQRLRVGELREGVWTRPSNLAPDRLAEDMVIIESQCDVFTVMSSDTGLAGRLWDLDLWAERAGALTKAMDELTPRLSDGDVSALRPGFLVSAAALRHFLADPLLPEPLEPRGWPGQSIRAVYDRYDTVYRELLTNWILQAVA